MAEYELRARVILFDMDGTLVDSTALVERLWHNWGSRHGIALETILSVSHGRRTVDTVRLVAPHLDAVSETQAIEGEESHSSEGIVALRGARRLLEGLDTTEWAVVTSAPHALALQRMAFAGLPTPPVLVGADDVRAGKPDPEGYLKAASMLEVKPQHCVVVEDTPAGILAARSAGMRVLAVGTTFPQSELLGAPWVPHFEDVRFVRES